MQQNTVSGFPRSRKTLKVCVLVKCLEKFLIRCFFSLTVNQSILYLSLSDSKLLLTSDPDGCCSSFCSLCAHFWLSVKKKPKPSRCCVRPCTISCANHNSDLFYLVQDGCRPQSFSAAAATL